ncbi:MAG: hypothetical protein HWD61_14365 [Parachlamydiaceae bacterium]|nr:MAG: hypothetical protein HWD61_14365 [Parachlamydiaceae bacterium]
MQIAQLFRAYFPQEAYELEQTKIYFEYPISELKQKIEETVPEMKGIFKRYLEDHPELMKKEEIYLGKTIWTITDLSKQMKAKGAWGLMSGINSFSEACKILKYGALSTEDRFKAGMIVMGTSSCEDLGVGCKSVFTRLITPNLKSKLSKMDFKGRLQVLYDLDAVNRVSYGYKMDKFGSKTCRLFQKRYARSINRKNE